MTGRVGLGIDFHRWEADRALVIGGVAIPHERGLAGHSDADVLTHAICDALLGAAGLGDIGVQFPDTDDRYRGISSLRLLERVVTLVAEAGFRASNVDCVVIGERPKLTPHFAAIRATLAPLLGIDPSCVGLKATTTEGMGALGREEGLASMCVGLIERGPEGP